MGGHSNVVCSTLLVQHVLCGTMGLLRRLMWGFLAVGEFSCPSALRLMLLCCHQEWGKRQSSCVWDRVLLYNQRVCSELNQGISASCAFSFLASQLACFWDRLKRNISGSTGLGYIIWDYRKDYLLCTAPLYLCVHLLSLCEEVSERPSSKKKKKNQNRKKPLTEQRRTVFHTGMFSWEPHGSFCISRALEYTHKKGVFYNT